MGKPARAKGRRGECAAKSLLRDRDWEIVADSSSGLSTDDLIALCPDGVLHSVEVKNCKSINLPAFRKQAIDNAKRRPWLLLMKLDGTKSWLIMGRGRRPVVWSEKGEEE